MSAIQHLEVCGQRISSSWMVLSRQELGRRLKRTKICQLHIRQRRRVSLWSVAGVLPPAWLEVAGFDSLMGWAPTTSTSMHLEGDLPPLASNSALFRHSTPHV